MQCFNVPKGKSIHKQVLLAHGAGAGMQSDFMQHIARELSENGVTTWLFDFPYMQKAQALGKKRPPDRAPVLLDAFSTAIGEVTSSRAFDPDVPFYIGGKSMGGRIASLWASDDELVLPENVSLAGVIALGYPFHPPGKPEKLRTEHLSTLRCPMLIVQGERDTFGNQSLVSELVLPDIVSLLWLADGDHSFKPRKASGFSQQAHIAQAADWIAAW
ncbi:alpha/beta fold hydrolase [Alteromonas facilis]|uniref:alpha/beta fold hydrolase n=1 Tax=Alteromonas facilis TaxID=2048004 RepID=UPI000C28148C|nr:alpha/beta fold hydrolase [Alteromonas facilis]